MDETATTETPRRFRFTLRTLFAVMAIGSGALASFIHYGPLPGLIFATFVLLGGWCYLRGKRTGVIIFVALFAALWMGLQFFGPYTSLRNRIVWIVGTERLQQWAVEVLDNPPPADKTGTIILHRAAMPEDIRAIAGNWTNIVLLSEDGTQDSIEFLYHRGFHRWSIVIQRPGFTPHHPMYFDKIADGIRGFNWRRPRPLTLIW